MNDIRSVRRSVTLELSPPLSVLPRKDLNRLYPRPFNCPLAVYTLGARSPSVPVLVFCRTPHPMDPSPTVEYDPTGPPKPLLDFLLSKPLLDFLLSFPRYTKGVGLPREELQETQSAYVPPCPRDLSSETDRIGPDPGLTPQKHRSTLDQGQGFLKWCILLFVSILVLCLLRVQRTPPPRPPGTSALGVTVDPSVFGIGTFHDRTDLGLSTHPESLRLLSKGSVQTEDF